MPESITTPLWPLALYAGLVLIIAAGMLAVSWVLGGRRRDAARAKPYESGIEPTGSARGRIPADFYLVGIFFVIFDLEGVFVFAWAVAIRKAGWAGYGEMLVFLGILLASLIYLLRVGALDWGKSRHRRRPPATEKGN